ncbi:MAG: hypothetical protein ABF649_19250 [Bacillus sp. (in: firmicutes)]
MHFSHAYVHLGIKYDKDLGYHIPKTFFVEKITPAKNGMKYVENQKEILVNKLDRITIQTQ